MLDDVGDAPPRAGVAFLFDDQRHVNRFVVDEQSVLLLAVIPEPFTVIRQQHDRGTVVELTRLQVLEKMPDDFVAVGNLAVVRQVLAEPWRRRVRPVRLVEMEEQERSRRSDRGEPALGDGFRDRAVALRLAEPGVGRGGHLAVEEIKPLGDAGVLPQHEGRDNAAGGVAALAQQLRQHALARPDGKSGVVADAGLERQVTGQQRRVSRKGLRSVRVGALEHHAIGCQAVDGRRPDFLVAVDRQVIRAQGVDRNDDNRPDDRRRRACVAPSSEGGERRPERGEEDYDREADGT